MRLSLRRDARWPWWLLVAVAFVVGGFLRVWQLGDQILIDDEWHALHKLFYAGALNIATHFGAADYCIPLTLYYRGLYDLHVLTEWSMRAPLLLGGVALLVMAPWCLRRAIALPTRAVWVALLAISPVLIYLTRTARPYALSGTLAFIAIIAFRRWWLRMPHARRWAAVYVVCAALAGWLQLLTLSFTLTPFLIYGVAALWRTAFRARHGDGRRELLRLAQLGIAVVALLSVFLLPPLINDWAAMIGKAGRGAVTWDSGYRTVLMLFGIAHPLACVVLGLLTLTGSVRLWRNQRELTVYLWLIMIIGASTICVSHAAWIEHPGVLTRYVMAVLPFMLLFLAEGVVAVLQCWWTAVPAVGVALLAMLALFAVGPLPYQLYWPNQFMGHARFQFAYDPLTALLDTGMKLGKVSPFYFDLARQPPRSLTIVEAPWRPESNFLPLPWYQQIDRQYRKIGLVTPLCGSRDWAEYPASNSHIHLTQFAHLTNILRGDNQGADLLVMHMYPWTSLPPQRLRWPDMRQCLATVEARLGRPFYRDAQIAVFALSPAGVRAAGDIRASR